MLFGTEIETLILITFVLLTVFFGITVKLQIKQYQEKIANTNSVAMVTIMPIVATSGYYLILTLCLLIRLTL